MEWKTSFRALAAAVAALQQKERKLSDAMLLLCPCCALCQLYVGFS
jgi:hypothetical protein